MHRVYVKRVVISSFLSEDAHPIYSPGPCETANWPEDLDWEIEFEGVVEIREEK